MDSAGREATLRAMEIVRGLGMNIRVVSLPQGKDPDEYINTQGPEKFQEAIDNAPNVLDYMLMTALQHHDETTLEGKAAITAAVMPVVAQVDNRVVLEGFCGRWRNGSISATERYKRNSTDMYRRILKQTNGK